MLDSLTFRSKKTYRRKILDNLDYLFGYKSKQKSILALRREIVHKHLPIPEKNLREFWKRESTLLKELVEKYPAEDFWLKVNFKSVPATSKLPDQEGKLRSFAQFFAWPYKDELERKYKEARYKIKEDDQIKIFEEKFGEDIIINRKPKTIKDFLNG